MANGNYQPFTPPNSSGIPFGSVPQNTGALYRMKSSTVRASAGAISQLGDSMYQNALNQNQGIDPGGKIAQTILQYAAGNISFSNSSDPTVQEKYAAFVAKYTSLMTNAQYGEPTQYDKTYLSQNIKSELDSMKGKDGFVAPQDALNQLQTWLYKPDGTPTGQTIGGFRSEFGQYLNPDNLSGYGVIKTPPNIFAVMSREATSAISDAVGKFTSLIGKK